MNTDKHTADSYRHAELTRQIVGVFFQVYGELGYGFLESVYRNAMTIALREAGLRAESEVELHARFRGQSVGMFRADLLVEGAVLVELKAARAIEQAHIAQLLNYLRCTVIEIGLILNFSAAPKVRRLVFTNDRKCGSIPRLRGIG
ncbi:MAG TPA: GxxExxY protein [Gemmatimonadales bacterium]|jgi:GxxExxY protein